MKRIFVMSLASLILLSGCGTEDNELLTAIDNSYDLKTGSIESSFSYSTKYNNIDIEGTVAGKIKILFGDQYDKVSANVNFEDNNETIEYYVDNKGNIITESAESNVAYAPLYIEAPDLKNYIDKIPAPTQETTMVNGKNVAVNKYSFNFGSLDTEVVRAMFDPILKLGFVSTNILQNEQINGDFSLNYFVDPTTGNLLKEVISFSNSSDDSLATKTNVEITNIYNYDQTDVELPARYGEDASSEAVGSEQ